MNYNRANVLVVYPTPFFSPLSLNNFTRLNALIETGIHVDLICFPEGDYFEHPNLHIKRFPSKPLFKKIENGEYLKILIYTLLIFLKVLFISKKKYKIVYTSGTLSPFLWIIKYFTKTPFVIFVISKFEDEIIKWGISHNKIIYNCIRFLDFITIKSYDFSIFQRLPLMEEFISRGIKPDRCCLIKQSMIIPYTKNIKSSFQSNSLFTILYAGTFVRVQNIDFLIELGIRLKDDGIKIQLIGASDKDFEIYKKKISNLKLEANIELLPRVNPEDLLPLIDAADVLISVRTFGYDTPIKIFHYLSLGKCIVATDCPIHNTVLNNDVSVLIKPNIDSFVEKIIELKKNPEICLSYSIKAKEYFEKEFSFHIQVENYQKVINYLVVNNNN